MNQNRSAGIPFRDLHFSMTGIHYRKLTTGLTDELTGTHTLLLIAGGQGKLEGSGLHVELNRGNSLLLPPVTTARIHQEGKQTLLYYLLSFTVYRMEDARGNGEVRLIPSSQEEVLPYGDMAATAFSRLEEMMMELYRHADEHEGQLQMADHFRFQNLMYFILERKVDPAGKESPEAAVGRTIQYIQQHYQEAINVEQLAQMAGISRRWYSSLFKEQTGQSPNHYLTDLRIRRAKEMLHITGSRFYDIARQVGFQDEHYFSRRFKQTVGLSPRQYVTNRRYLGMSVTYPELLYSLGITPIAAPVFQNDFPSYLKSEFSGVFRLNDSKKLDYESIRSARPDFILAPAWKDQHHYEELSRIAPTVLLPEQEDWRDELRDMAEILGKRKEAERVIQDYESRIAVAKERLQSMIGDESVMYVRISGDEAYIHGMHSHRGKTIHRELGLKPAALLYNESQGITLSSETLRRLSIDHIILHIDEQIQAREFYEELSQSEQWNGLTAVMNKQVYPVRGRDWYNFSFSPIATGYAAEEMVRILEKRQRKPRHF
ncbi:ABC transporter substrate-binding protein [Paenibacillus timonensis]|uniref:ABC transporter substrate-binding protein n=1 Tax=Paenibacillus timonensis TaxID=225915 RepID=UPI003F94CB02